MPTSEHTPVRQRPAREQQAAGVIIPYFHPSERDHLPVTYHLTLVKFPAEVLNRLVVAARANAASKEYLRNPLDNRKGLAYRPMPRETVNFLRHTCLNRSSDKQAHIPMGYTNSYDNIISKIERKGVDVAERIRAFKVNVLHLIASTYPDLALECEEQIFHINRNHQEK